MTEQRDWGASHPLVTIDFLVEGVEDLPDDHPDTGRVYATRHWHHVPRFGDVVELPEVGGGRRVTGVYWDDHGITIVLIGPKP